MAPAEGGVLTPDVYGRDLIAELPSLARVADIETRILMNLDSGDMQPDDWVALAREVHDALATGKYQGIVVVHGTDTMAYSASALAFLLGGVRGKTRPALRTRRRSVPANLCDSPCPAGSRG